MPRGGKRKGAGRPNGVTRTRITVSLTHELAALVTLQAERCGLDRTAWVAAACRRELDRQARHR